MKKRTHENCIKMLGQINETVSRIASFEDKAIKTNDTTCDPYIRSLQSTANVLIEEYNRELKTLKPLKELSIGDAFFRRICKALSIRLANSLRFYFDQMEVESPTREQFMAIDMDKLCKVRNFGAGSQKELMLLLQEMS